MISIIIPVYNVEKYITDCINSCLQQTYTNFEIIAINDGSSDSSGTILDSLKEKDNRIRVIHKKNEGVAKTRVLGIEKATGDFLFFLDSDDTLPSDCLESLRNNIEESNSDIAIGDYVECSEKEILRHCQYTYLKNIMSSEEYIDLLLSDKIPNGIWGKLYRNLKSVNITPTSYKLGEDTTLLIQYAFNAKKISHIKKSTYNYLQRFDSVDHVKKPSYLSDMFYYRLWVVDYLKEKDVKYERNFLIDFYIIRGYIRCIFWGGGELLPNRLYTELNELYNNVKCKLPLWERIVYKTMPLKRINKLIIFILHIIRNIKK